MIYKFFFWRSLFSYQTDGDLVGAQWDPREKYYSSLVRFCPVPSNYSKLHLSDLDKCWGMRGEQAVIEDLTILVSCHGWHADIIVRPAICDENHDLPFVGFGLAEQLLWGVADGCSRAGAPTPVTDPFDSVQHVLLHAVLVKAELQPLLIGVLHSSDACVGVWNLELLADVGHKLENRAEVAGADAAGAIDHEADVGGVEARLAASQPVGVAYPLHQGLHHLVEAEPAGHVDGIETTCPAHCLQGNMRINAMENRSACSC